MSEKKLKKKHHHHCHQRAIKIIQNFLNISNYAEKEIS